MSINYISMQLSMWLIIYKYYRNRNRVLYSRISRCPSLLPTKLKSKCLITQTRKLIHDLAPTVHHERIMFHNCYRISLDLNIPTNIYKVDICYHLHINIYENHSCLSTSCAVYCICLKLLANFLLIQYSA